MKILHSSDWHIGHILYGCKRYEEFEKFSVWLIATLKSENIEVLLIAGDIFDTATPSNEALKIYYGILHRISETNCRHVVIIGGNHDSPSLLNAPRDLLRFLDVHVIGSPVETIEDCILSLKDKNDVTELIVCAIPYLRDRDVRKSEEFHGHEDRASKHKEGIKKYYEKVIEKGEEIRNGLATSVPLISMGHLFAAGGVTVEGDGVRDLYVGNLAHINADVFPLNLDYVALGHLHRQQVVDGKEHISYSGSPLPMGFGESTQKKSVTILEFANGQRTISFIEVPLFQELVRIIGDVKGINKKINELKNMESKAWLEVIYDGTEIIPNLKGDIEASVGSSSLKVLSIKNNLVIKDVLQKMSHTESLADDLDPEKLFKRFLDQNTIDEGQKMMLIELYTAACTALAEYDSKKD